MNVPATVVDIEVLGDRIVSNGIRVLQEFHAGHGTVRCAIEDLQISRISVGNVNAVQILPIEHGMRLANPIYFVNQFACLQIKHNDSMVAFRSRKKPPAFQVNSEMVEVPLNLCRQLKRLDQFDWCSHLTPGLDSEHHEGRHKDEGPFLHFLSLSWNASYVK